MRNNIIRILLMLLLLSLLTTVFITNYTYGEEKTVVEKTEFKNMIIFERKTIDNFFNIQSIYNVDYDEIRAIIFYNKAYEIDDGELEKQYQEYMYNWIRNEKHRYYDYTTVSRKRFYNKKIGEDFFNVYELYTILRR